VLRPVSPADPQKGPFPEVLQTIRRLLIRPGRFRLERELPGGICTHDICAPWQGTQWNRIEHRLFSFITQNWRGKPLVSYQAIVQLIGATTTRTGLKVQCAIDDARYPAGVKVSDAEMADLKLTPHAFHGDWNYTIEPRPP
jgi:hypothetical protein